MRVFAILLLCLALATCSSPVLLPAISTPAKAELNGRHNVQLIALPAPHDSTATPAGRLAQLTAMLRETLAQRGYLEGSPADLRAYYWLGLHDTPLEFSVDQPPPGPLGPYQSVHRLHDESATLHLRLTDLQDRVLWEGQIDTGLSPAWDSHEQLQKACSALLQQLPLAH